MWKLKIKHGRKGKLPPDKFRFKPPIAITFRHLGIKDAELRIVDKSIPILATKNGTNKQRRRWGYWWWSWINSMFLEIKAHPFFRSKFNTHDDLDDDHDEYEMEITEENWNRNIHSHMAVYALVINASNIFRFPHDCYQHGGVVFFLAYAFVSLFIVQPIIYLEMVVGQFSQTGVDGFGALHVFAKGIPQAIVFMSLVFVPYNSIVEGYTGKYVLGTFYSQAGNCHDTWNALNSCISYDEIPRFGSPQALKGKNIWIETSTARSSLLSTELYFRQYILHHRWDGTNDNAYAGWNPYLFIGVGVTYILVLISIRVRLTSISSKIIIILSALLPLLLLILLTCQVFRDGALNGILDLFFFQVHNWGNLFSVKFWFEVFRSSFLTSGIGYGLYSRVASRNPFNKDSLYRSSWMVVILTLIISLMTSFILMAELGAIRFIFQGSSYGTIFAEHTGSVFAAISGALLKLNSRICIFIFFAACTTCGIWSQIVATENCTSQIVNWFSIATENLQCARYIALILVIGLQGAFATLVSKAGGVMLDSSLFDGTWAAAFVSLAEVISIAYIYGTVFFMIDIELMLRHSAPRLFKFQLRYSSPVAISIMLLVISFGHMYYGEEKYLGIIPTPDFVVYSGYTFNAVPPILIVLLAGLGIFYKKQKGLFWVPGIDYLKNIFGRIRQRRSAIFKSRHANVHTITSDAIQKLRQVERALSLKKLRAQLSSIKTSRKARANWLRLTNKILVSEGHLNSMSKVAGWIVRELELQRVRKEVKYLRKIMRNYSMECIFTVPKEINSRLIPRKREREHLASILLNSLPLEDLGFKYPKLSLYERLVGKANPIPEEDKASLIVRIKRHLGVECTRDAKIWLRLLEKLEEKRKKNTVFREDTPIEFHFEYAPTQQLIRVIMFKGLDHSILINSPIPRPPMVQIVQRHLRQRVGRALWTYLKDIVTQEMESEKGIATIGRTKMSLIKERKTQSDLVESPVQSRSSSRVTIDTKFSTSSQAQDEPVIDPLRIPWSYEGRPLFTPLENWYHNCDTRRFKISATNTFFIVILDRHALREMVKDRFALILPPENLMRPREIVEFNTPGVYEVTYAGIRPFLEKMAERKKLLTKPIDEFPAVHLTSIDSQVQVSFRRGKNREDFDIKNPLGPYVTEDESPRYSEMDLFVRRRSKPTIIGSSSPPQKRMSDSLIAEMRRNAVKGQMQARQDVDLPIYTNIFESSDSLADKSRRKTGPVPSSDQWADSHILKMRWQKNADPHLTRARSEHDSEKTMATWLSGTKGKMIGKMNEEDAFFYRRKGKELVVEPRKGRLKTSSIDTAIMKEKQERK